MEPQELLDRLEAAIQDGERVAENIVHAARQMSDAADKMNSAASRMGEAAGTMAMAGRR